MHHLSQIVQAHTASLPLYLDVKTWELNHMLRCLCGPPSIPLSFNLAAVLPRRNAYCVDSGTEGVDTSYT